MAPQKVNLKNAFSRISEYRTPVTAGELNGQEIRLVKMKGEFIWHHHEHEDEMFLVVKGGFTMCLRTGDVELTEGDFIIIPRGVEHKPFAAHEAHIVLFEPAATLNTGNVQNEFTKRASVF